ncbi:MAG: hypothetical protein GY887_10300 [Halieaceae bacterium]|nr:hypothetical protein [Halieaceae bacterium]MCP4842107.1 hypothetical protein [Halieaceae bacterium]MDG2411531.1 hypothetical protein [Halioglobus sp.]
MRNITLFKPLSVVALTLSIYMVTTPALAQRTGDSARVTVGTVESSAPVQLQSNSGRNALIGGALGWALARNKSSGTQAAAALGGAALGGGGTAASEGKNTAMQYTIRTSAGSAIQVITDQTEIRIGDCVLVEESGNNTNVRRKDPAMCRPTSNQVMSQVQGELQDDADQCHQAKQRLFNAKTPDEVEVARQVMEILCND